MKKIFIFIILLISCIKKPIVKKTSPNELFNKGIEYYSQGKFDEAESLLKIVAVNTKEKSILGKSYYYLGKISEKTNKIKEAIVYLSAAYNVGYGEKDKFLELIGNVSPSIVEKELKGIPNSLKPDVLWILGRNFLKEGDNKKTEKLYKILISEFPSHPYSNEARNFLKGGRIYKIAVILPLTGEYSDIGKAVKKGIEGYSNPRFNLYYYDSSEDPIKMFQIMKEIVSNKFDGGIGPLLSNNAVISSIFANLYNILIISPTATSNILDKFGPYFIGINKSLTIQSYAAANYAFNVLGARKAAIIFPESEYGRKAFSDFQEFYESFGGKVVYYASYLKDKSDFKEYLKNVDRKDADVLFIPGTSEDITSLVPQIKYYNVKAQVIGGEGWNSPELIRKIGKEYFEGVIVIDMKIKNDIFKDYDSYEELRLMQLGYDALKLLDYLLGVDISKGIRSVNFSQIELNAGSVDAKKDIDKIGVYIIKNGKLEFLNVK